MEWCQRPDTFGRLLTIKTPLVLGHSVLLVSLLNESRFQKLINSSCP